MDENIFFHLVWTKYGKLKKYRAVLQLILEKVSHRYRQ